METVLNTSETGERLSEGNEENNFMTSGVTLLFNRKSFETDKRENLHTDVLIVSCENPA